MKLSMNGHDLGAKSEKRCETNTNDQNSTFAMADIPTKHKYWERLNQFK